MGTVCRIGLDIAKNFFQVLRHTVNRCSQRLYTQRAVAYHGVAFPHSLCMAGGLLLSHGLPGARGIQHPFREITPPPLSRL